MIVNKERLNWLVDGGEITDLIQSIDWSKTPLGSIDQWPQSLRTTVSLCLSSNFPINIIWGPEAIQIYNQGYRVVCGGAHPRATGEPYHVTWASAWPVIGEPFEQARKGKTSYLENQRMFLNRNGYLEETFFTFSLSPIRDENGGIAGLFHPVTETTVTMLSARRTRALRDLADKAKSKSTHGIVEISRLIVQVLSSYRFDLPFVLFYLFNPDNKLELIAQMGLPSRLDPIIRSGSLWSFDSLGDSDRLSLLTDIMSRIGNVPCGDYPEPVEKAFVLPIKSAGLERPLGFAVAGLSTRLPLDEVYQNFFEMLGNTLTAIINEASAYDNERKRAEALAELNRAKTTFFSNVSHEFRTPLTLMLGPLEDLLAGRKGELGAEVRAEAEVVHRNALRLLKLVNTLLDFSRLEANRVSGNYELTDLTGMTRDLSSAFRSAIEKAGMKLNVDLSDGLEAYVDRDMWEKIVLNLLSNAFKYTLQGEIRITLKKVAKMVELAVNDTGIGISEKELPKVFQRFHRVQGAQGRTHEGTGIGLALVQELVTLHGGQIQVQSTVGKGSTFTVTIPLKQNRPSKGLSPSGQHLSPTTNRTETFITEALHYLSEETNKNGDLGTAAAQKQTAISGRKKILLADDNADMRAYIRKMLSLQYEVLLAENGKKALELARSSKVDLILSDIMMPEMDGIELLTAIRADANLKTLPVILLSARAGEEAKASGIEMGADDYLVKPFSAMELQARIQTQLSLSDMRTTLLRDLAASNRELESFSYSVSHDLRAPLRNINGLSEILLEEYSDKLDEQGKKYLKRIRLASKRMGQIIDDLLRLAKIAHSELRRETINLSELVNKICDGFKSETIDRNIDFLIARDIMVEGDRGLLQTALENLLSNAIKFTAKHASARIEFGMQEQDGKQVYFIRDDGAGFDSIYSTRLFRVFQRLHRNDEFAGTGVGLATTLRVIERHGGRIWAEGAIEKGATFYFTL